MKDVVTPGRQLRQKAPLSERERSSLCPAEGSRPYMETLRKSHRVCGGGGVGTALRHLSRPCPNSEHAISLQENVFNQLNALLPAQGEGEGEGARAEEGRGRDSTQKMGIQASGTQVSGERAASGGRKETGQGRREEEQTWAHIQHTALRLWCRSGGKRQNEPNIKVSQEKKKRKNKQTTSKNVIRPSKGGRGVRTLEERATPGTGSPIEASVPATP